jgi:hypothetical protein
MRPTQAVCHTASLVVPSWSPIASNACLANLCSRRFHPQCVGLSSEEAEQATFRCPGCLKKKPAAIAAAKRLKLYCVCRSPEEDEAMIACDYCSEW